MKNMKISLWEVVEPTELPKSLEMTMTMKAILKSRKAQITPRFLDFSNEILTLTANNLEKFKDDLDFLREMSELPKHLSKNESPVLDLSLPQKEFTFFLTEVIKIANHYNVVILLEDLWFAFLPQDVIYPVDAREKWQQINSETDATPFDTIENLKDWAKDKIAQLVSKYGFKPVSDDFPRTHMTYKDAFYYQRKVSVGTQLIGIYLYNYPSKYEEDRFRMAIIGVIYAPELLEIYNKFIVSSSNIDRQAFYYHSGSYNKYLEGDIHTKADFYCKHLFKRLEIELIINTMNIGSTLEGLKKLGISSTKALILNYLLNTLNYETQQNIFLMTPQKKELAEEFLKLFYYIQEQQMIAKKESQ